jgi:hypothetical protein
MARVPEGRPQAEKGLRSHLRKLYEPGATDFGTGTERSGGRASNRWVRRGAELVKGGFRTIFVPPLDAYAHIEVVEASWLPSAVNESLQQYHDANPLSLSAVLGDSPEQIAQRYGTIAVPHGASVKESEVIRAVKGIQNRKVILLEDADAAEFLIREVWLSKAITRGIIHDPIGQERFMSGVKELLTAEVPDNKLGELVTNPIVADYTRFVLDRIGETRTHGGHYQISKNHVLKNMGAVDSIDPFSDEIIEAAMRILSTPVSDASDRTYWHVFGELTERGDQLVRDPAVLAALEASGSTNVKYLLPDALDKIPRVVKNMASFLSTMSNGARSVLKPPGDFPARMIMRKNLLTESWQDSDN